MSDNRQEERNSVTIIQVAWGSGGFCSNNATLDILQITPHEGASRLALGVSPSGVNHANTDTHTANTDTHTANTDTHTVDIFTTATNCGTYKNAAVRKLLNH